MHTASAHGVHLKNNPRELSSRRQLSPVRAQFCAASESMLQGSAKPQLQPSCVHGASQSPARGTEPCGEEGSPQLPAGRAKPPRREGRHPREQLTRGGQCLAHTAVHGHKGVGMRSACPRRRGRGVASWTPTVPTLPRCGQRSPFPRGVGKSTQNFPVWESRPQERLRTSGLSAGLQGGRRPPLAL